MLKATLLQPTRLLKRYRFIDHNYRICNFISIMTSHEFVRFKHSSTSKVPCDSSPPAGKDDIPNIIEKSKVSGVSWNQRDRGWHVSWCYRINEEEMKRAQKYFSARKYGFEPAKSFAEKQERLGIAVLNDALTMDKQMKRAKYQSDVNRVHWDKLHDGWIVVWYNFDGKRKGKFFSLKKFESVEESKKNAEEYRKMLEKTGQVRLKGMYQPVEAKYQCSVVGVSFNSQSNLWVARWMHNGKQRSKVFAVNKYGFEEAKQYAIDRRLEEEKKKEKE